MPHVRRMAVVLVLALIGALLIKVRFKPAPSALVTIASADVPLAVAGYTSPPDDAETWKREAQAQVYISQSQVISRTYRADADPGGSDRIDFLLVSGSGRTALHDPRLCLTGSGWRLSDARTESLPGTPIVMQRNEAATVSDVPDTSLTYFYIVKGRAISSPTEIRLALLGSALLGRDNAPIYFFRFIQPVNPDPAVARRNHAHLQEFAAQMWRTLRPHLRAA